MADLILAYLRSIIGKSDIRELNPSASPGLTTLLDTVLYKSNEGCLTATVCAADAVLASLLELKHVAKCLLKAILLSEAEEYLPSDEVVIKRQTIKGSSNSKRNISNCVKRIIFKEQVEDFARLCLEYSNHCVEKITCDQLAQSANINSHNDHEVCNSPEQLHQQYLNSSYFHDDARPKALNPSNCWESPRLFCPDYIWADEAIQYCINSLSILTKHKFLNTGKKTDHIPQYFNSSNDKSSSNVKTWHNLPPSCVNFANKAIYLIQLDLPTKLCQFRTAVESEALTLKRLYLVKCEYRAPFRSFLESLSLLLELPSRVLIEKYIDLHQNHKPVKKITSINNEIVNDDMNDFLHSLFPHASSSMPTSILLQQRQHMQQTFSKCLQNPDLAKALNMEQYMEILEVGMSQLLLPFTDLARLLHSKRCRIVAYSNVLELRNVPAMREMIYRLRLVLAQSIKRQANVKSGTQLNNQDGTNDSSYGIRPILVDILGTAPRKDSEIDIFDVTIIDGSATSSYHEEDDKSNSNNNVRIRLGKFMYLLQTLADLIKNKESLVYLEKKETDIPSSLIKQCISFDRDLFEAQFYDWSTLVEMQYEHVCNDTGGSFSVNDDLSKGPGAKNCLSTFLLKTKEKEIELSVAMSSETALLDMRIHVNRIEMDVEKRFKILKDFVQSIGLREMNMKIYLKKPSVLLHESNVDDSAPKTPEQHATGDYIRSRGLELKKTTAVGIFGHRLLMAGEKLPMG